MFCIHCGAQIEENDRFCPKCGKSISEASEKENFVEEGQMPQGESSAAPAESPAQAQGPQSASPGTYPYYVPPVAPGMAGPKKKNGWIVPLLIGVGILIIGLIFVGVFLGYSVYTTIRDEGYFPGGVVTEIGTMGDLEPYVGGSKDKLTKEKGLLLTDQGDGSYANLNGSITVYQDEDGDINMLVLSGKDTGFSLCGVSMSMSKEEALSQVKAYLGNGEIYEDMVIGQSSNGFQFSAWLDETGAVDYMMYFNGEDEIAQEQDDQITQDSGVWYLGESLSDAWEWFGTNYTVDQQEYSAGIYYADQGLYFSTTQLPYTGDSVISYIAFDQGACFAEDLFVGMTYSEWLPYMDLGEIVVDDATGGYVSYFTVYFDDRECYGAVSFDGVEPDAKSTAAFFKSDELM